MIGEMYVVKMVQLSGVARSVVAARIGVADQGRQIEALRNPGACERIASLSGCRPEEAFSFLAQEIHEATTQTILPRFGRHHLSALLEDWAKARLGTLLRCSPSHAISHLFDAVALTRTLTEVEPNASRSTALDADFLLLNLTSVRNRGSIELLYGEGPNAWGAILIQECWLLESAVKALGEYAQSLEWPTDDPTRILAALLDGSTVPASAGEEGVRFDRLALGWLKQRVLHVIHVLREQAVERAREASLYCTDDAAIRNLLPWIEMYERGAIARMLPHLVTRKRPLTSFLIGHQFEGTALEGMPAAGNPLIVENNHTYEREVSSEEPRTGIRAVMPAALFGPKRRRTVETRGGFEIKCRMEQDESLQTILTLHDLSVETYEHLLQAVPSVASSEIPADPRAISVRVLETPILVNDPLALAIGSAIKAMESSFVPAIVLSGVTVPIPMDAPWRNLLTDKLPFSVPQYDQALDFPKHLGDIVDEFRTECTTATLVSL